MTSGSLVSVSPCGDERAAGPTRFLSLGRVLCVSGVFIVALGLGGRWGLLRHRGPGGGWHLRRPPRRRGGGRWGRRLVWADGAVARARLWRFSLSPCVDRGAHRRVTVLEDSARTAGGVLSSAASWQSGRLLHAPGRGTALLRRPRSVLMRRTGHFLVGFEGRPTFVQHSRAVDVADRKSGRDLSAFWRSLAVVVPPARLRCTLAARWAG